MRDGSTAESTELIQEALRNSNCKTAVKLEVYTDGAYEPIEDFDVLSGVDWTESGKNRKFASYALTPLAGTIRFQIDNINGKYSPGSGQDEEDYFDVGTKIRLSAGYYLPEPLAQADNALTLNDTGGIIVWSYFYRTIYSGGSVILDQSNGSLTHFTDLFTPLYDSETYDDSTYSPDAYTVQTYDAVSIGYEEIIAFKVTANSAKGEVYFRYTNDPNNLDNSVLADWTYAGVTINGEQTYDIVDNGTRYLQIGVVWDGVAWGDSDAISSMKATTKSNVDFIYKSVYYLDQPEFDDPPAPMAPKVFCNGRDAYKRAIATDLNLQDYSGTNITPTNLIKEVCDQVGIRYSATSIDTITGFTDIAWGDGFDDLKTANDVFGFLMEKIISSDYQMWLKYDETIDDNILYVQQKPDSSTEADGAFDFKKYVSIGASTRNGDKVLQRFTVITDSQVTDAETLLDSATISATGDQSFAWTGNAVYKRFEVDAADRDSIKGTVACTPTSATLTVTEITGSVEVRLYGNKYSSTEPTYEGEAINFNNQITGLGTTARTTNPLMSSDAECKASAEKFITDFGNPTKESTGLVYPYLNLLWELNDLALMWRRFFFDDDLYFITKISHHWDLKSQPRQDTSYDLEDSGNNFSDISDFIYDDTPIAMKYDKGYLYDMGISTPLSTDEEIDAASVMIYNVPFS